MVKVVTVKASPKVIVVEVNVKEVVGMGFVLMKVIAASHHGGTCHDRSRSSGNY